MTTLCNICASETNLVFDSVLLKKYKVNYFKCKTCGFIQTEKPYWLKEAYSFAISELDIGLIYRNLNLAEFTEKFLENDIINPDGHYIDYGGGYGMFVRLMRDKGYAFYRQDIHCENLFAKHFDISDLTMNNGFELLTAFEVFEHLEFPAMELEKMLSYSDTILFSTELLPDGNPDPKTWWYFVPETGQHISLFTIKSLQFLGAPLNLNFYSDGTSLHMFTKKVLKDNPFENISKSSYVGGLLRIFSKKQKIKRNSLLMSDFENVRKLINDHTTNINF